MPFQKQQSTSDYPPPLKIRKMKEAIAMEMVFIPTPGMGHLVSAVELAKLLLQKRSNLSISVLIIKPNYQSEVNSYIDSLLSNDNNGGGSRLKFTELPSPAPTEHPNRSFVSVIEAHKPGVRDYVNQTKDTVKIAGIVVDMFCTTMVDVAEEFGIPPYVFYPSGAAFLGLHLHLQDLHARGVDVSELKGSHPDLEVPTYSRPFPVRCLPARLQDKQNGTDMFMGIAKRIRETEGILVNTFFELETHALRALSRDENLPPVYPVGPVLNLGETGDSEDKITEWLDGQPGSSVVFLCFGSVGSFPETQVREIAHALENSGRRFLWALRRPPQEGAFQPTNYDDFNEVLPEGFLERTKNIGKVIGWAPQARVLAHPAVGGFVSHCGWNSTLESVWFGVPMATWPIYAEQQANAFHLVTNIGNAVEIKMDYRRAFLATDEVVENVTAGEIERGIKNLIDDDGDSNPARLKAKELKAKSRNALQDGGSSYTYLECFFEDLMRNLV